MTLFSDLFWFVLVLVLQLYKHLYAENELLSLDKCAEQFMSRVEIMNSVGRNKVHSTQEEEPLLLNL